jgi:hypothetical protein
LPIIGKAEPKVAEFSSYAEIVTPEHPLQKMYAAGISSRPPGRRLSDILAETGGVYQMDLPIARKMRKDIRQVAELSSDKELLAIADRGTFPVSFEEFRGKDPETIIVYGHYLNYTEEEMMQLRSEDPPDLDPRKTMYWNNEA